MQNDLSGARVHHPRVAGEEHSPEEAAKAAWGQVFKQYVRAAAAIQGLYDDVALAKAVKVQRGAVRAWWLGAKPSPTTLTRIAEGTGLDVAELIAFTYYDGPPPRLPDPVAEERVAHDRADEAERSHHARLGDGASEEQSVHRGTTG